MSVNGNNKSIRRPFFLATDEGDIYSEHVGAIIKEMTAEAGPYNGKTVTELRLNVPKVEKSMLHKPYVLASIGTVRDLFKEHGYEFVTEDVLQELELKRAPAP